jgi:hypothetical protein
MIICDNARYQTGGHARIGVRVAERLIEQDPTGSTVAPVAVR